MSEASEKFNFGKPQNLPGADMNIPNSIRDLQAIKPDSGHSMRIGAEARMQRPEDGNPEDEKLSQLDLERLFATERSTNLSAASRFVDKLSKYEEDGREENLRSAERAYTDMISECLEEIDDLYVKDVEQRKNAYPYDHRQAEYAVEIVDRSISAFEKRGNKTMQREVLLTDARKDVEWMGAFLDTTVVQTASLPYYFDVVQQLHVLRESKYRKYLTAEMMEKTFAGKLPGIEQTQQHERDKQDYRIGIFIPKEYQEYDDSLIRPGEKVCVREIATRLQDRSFEVRMRLAAVSQVDFTKPNPETTTFMGDNLTPQELEFYKSIFWWKNPNKNEGQIMSPYITGNENDVREITSKIEAIMLTNASEVIKDIDPNDHAAISDLAHEVKEVALERQENWYTRGKKDILSQLAVVITKQGFLQDFSFMHSSEYCWQYVWKLDGGGRPIEIDKIDLGGIDTWSGDLPSLYWAQRKHRYDALSNSCTTFLPATDREMRTEVEKIPPTKMPEFPPDLIGHPDNYLKENWELLFGKSIDAQNQRKALGYKDLSDNISNKLKDWVFKWRTPFNNKFLGTDGKDYKLDIPFFIPPYLDIANYFKTISTEGKVNSGAKTIWEELVEGKKLSEVPWIKTKTQQHDRWMVDMEMASRYMTFLIEAVDSQKDTVLGLFSGDPGTLGPKELAKRIRLSFRDSQEGKPTEYEAGMIPLIIVLAAANKHNIFSSYAFRQITDEDRELNSCPAERFLMEMSYWKRALKWLPGDRPSKDGIVDMDYGNNLALIAEFYEAVILRIAKASSEEAKQLARENYQRTADRLNRLDVLQHGNSPLKINKDRLMTK